MSLDEKWLTVSQLTTRIKKTIEMNDQLQQVWLRAEISNFKKHSRGHMYFTLKDEKAKISAVMFAGNNRKLKFVPENGMKVLLQGHISVYEPFGQYQLYVREMEPDGIGQLYIRYEQLKKSLEEEGLFAEERKKPLPAVPKEIAVITSPTGAAVKDMMSTLKRRFPPARITLFPVLVQGREAPASIVRAMEQAEEMGTFDVILFGRGGGSIEELWAFNEEITARKIASLSTPAVSAVGHETDFTIADFTADVRAATPTAAAELAVPVLSDLLSGLAQMKSRLVRALQADTNKKREHLTRLNRSYAFRYPSHLLKQKEQELDRMLERMNKSLEGRKKNGETSLQSLTERLHRRHPQRLLEKETDRLTSLHARAEKAADRMIQNKRGEFHHVLQKLRILNPLDIMERGYHVAYTETGTLLTSASQLQTGDNMTMYLRDGEVEAGVKHVNDTTLMDKMNNSSEEGGRNRE
ncbi:exodeoxyribonuclease VII large subunit [Salibacterium halotolerans]|uniref:Exodeoxyribonuclease 7 large subunit n=1 Tax=Salibacterium halotolerans TaxID=1884432 RepID=A0A1I5NP63_9BACI|nr:exodeoxyribonuclease VII large subunit [Salibacterium halotolerans]SFP23522.1 exodeoxyribonuclease VII large subunit [Salibacterium halotolerans]